MEDWRTRRADLGIALAGVIAAAGIWSFSFSTAEFIRPDAHDYAQMGRELNELRGYSTLQIFPRHVPFLMKVGELDADRWPNLYRYPLTVSFHAAAQLGIEDPVRAGVMQGGVAFAVGVGVCFLLARRVANRASALAATLVAASEPLWFASSYDGMSEAGAVLLALLAFWTALAVRPGVLRAAILGAICGLAFMARTQLAVLLPLACGAMFWFGAERRRLRLMIVVVVASAAIASPWLVRNTLVAGQPFFSLSSSRNLFKTNRLDLDRDLHEPTSLAALLSMHPNVIGSKLAEGFGERLISIEHWTDALGTASLAAAVVILSFAWRRRGPPTLDALRVGSLLLLVANFGVVSLTFHNERFYAITRVLLLVTAVCELSMLAQHRRVRGLPLGLAVAMLFGALGVLRYGALAFEHRGYSDRPASEVVAYAAIADEVPSDAVIASNFSDRIALHSKRRSLRLPLYPEQLFEIDRDYLPIDYVAIPRNLAKVDPWYFRYGDFIVHPSFRSRYELVKPLANGLVLFRRRTSQLPRAGSSSLHPESR